MAYRCITIGGVCARQVCRRCLAVNVNHIYIAHPTSYQKKLFLRCWWQRETLLSLQRFGLAHICTIRFDNKGCRHPESSMHALHCGANCKVINALHSPNSHTMWTWTHCMQIPNVMEFCFRVSLCIYDLTRFSHFHRVDSQCFRWPLAAIVDNMELISIQSFRTNDVRIAASDRATQRASEPLSFDSSFDKAAVKNPSLHISQGCSNS